MKAQETNVHKLLQGTKVFIVPNFQRRYSWRREQWQDLWDDVMAEYVRQFHENYAEVLDGHFLGSVVLHPAGGPASTVARYLVIDGQQRLTTLLVMISALRDVRRAVDPTFDPAEYDSQYLSNPFNPRDRERLSPTTFDRAAYVETVRDRTPMGGIGQAYSWFTDKIQELRATDKNANLERLGQAILLRLILVEINTSQADSVNNIFNTLNSKGMPLSPADLIRNELLLNLADSHSTDNAYAEYWLPMERLLVHSKSKNGGVDDARLINYFWSQELRYEPGLAVKDLFPTFERRLRHRLNGLDRERRGAVVEGDIKKLNEQCDIYLAIIQGDHYEGRAAGLSERIRQRLDWLRLWGSSPANPVIFGILIALDERRATPDQALRALDLLLSYLVRRAVAGVPTNNLNRLLSPLPSQFEQSSGSLDREVEQVFSRPGYRWPTDADLLAGAESTALYLTTKRSQSKFILSQIEAALEPKEHVDFDALSLEHIFPQSITSEWEDAIGGLRESLEDAKALLHTIGNLTLTGHNSRLSNSSFGDKRRLYRESTVRMSQEISLLESWGPTAIRRRSRQMALAVARIWQGPPTRTERGEVEEISSRAGLTDALNSIPEGSWTDDDALSTALAMPLDEVRAIVSSLGAELARVVRTEMGDVPNWVPSLLASQVRAQDQPLDLRDKGTYVDADLLARLSGWVEGTELVEA